jgi:hypothetical protein
MGLLGLLLAAAVALAEPIHVYTFDDEGAAEGWNRKSNTTIDVRAPEPHDGAGAMRFTIDPTEFAYGWIHRALPDVDLSAAEGIHGFYRANAGAQGKLRLYLCLSTPNEDLSYLGGDVGELGDSGGEWLEFYVPLSGLAWERGPVTSLRERPLGPTDLLQFLSSVEGKQPVSIDLDTVAFLPAEDAAPIAKRVKQAERARMLLPEGQRGGAPHPRLLLTEDRLPYFRAKAHAGDERQAAYGRLLALAEDLLKTYNANDPLGAVYQFVETSTAEGVPWRAGFEGEIVNCSYPIEVLGAAYRLTGDERFGKHGARALANAPSRLTADETFLSRGFYYSRTFYVRALAFGYDWLWDQLTPAERTQVQTTLLGFLLDIHQHSQTDGWGRRPLHRVWNWDPGLMGACGLGMLALEGETRVAEKAIIFDCRRHLRDYLTLGIDADGCGHEGPNYLGYGIGAGVEFAEVLRQQGRGDLFADTNYRLIAPWLIAETLPDGRRWNNLSDCGHGQRAYPVYLYACGRYAELARDDSRREGERLTVPTLSRPLDFLAQFSEKPGDRALSYGALAELMGWEWRTGLGRAAPAEYDARTALAHVLLYEPVPACADPTQYLPLAMHFRGRGLVASRTGFGPDDLHLAIEAGPHAAGHDQSDKGTFTLRAYGGDLAIDSGYGNDGDPLKSGSSLAHNVVLIDGQGQPMAYHNQSSGHITGFCGSKLVDWVRLDAREAWGVRYDADWQPRPTSPVKRADRTFVFVRPAEGVPPYLVVYDDIAKDEAEHQYTWQWHIPATMQFETDGRPWVASPKPWDLPVLTSTPDKPGGSATFRLTVPQVGRYILYGLVRVGGPEIGKSDSFLVSIDGGERLTWDLGVGANLAWDAFRARGEGGPRVLDLTAGEHTVLLAFREPQAEFAGWRLLPEGAQPPVEPSLPNGAVSLDAAAMGDPPFIRREAGAITGPTASIDVFPLNPEGGVVTTDWFQTSREGAHPRLSYTVGAVDPHFLMLLLPRREGVPRPEVEVVRDEEGVGVEVRWATATDRVLFSDGTARLGPVELRGSAAFIRERGGKAEAWGAFDALRLAYKGERLFEAADPIVRVSD